MLYFSLYLSLSLNCSRVKQEAENNTRREHARYRVKGCFKFFAGGLIKATHSQSFAYSTVGTCALYQRDAASSVSISFRYFSSGRVTIRR